MPEREPSRNSSVEAVRWLDPSIPARDYFINDRHPCTWISTPNLRAAARMRFHAASRSSSVTPSTWSNRATALRTWRASVIGSLRSFVNAKRSRGSLFFWRVLRTLLLFAAISYLPDHLRTVFALAVNQFPPLW